MFEWLKDKFPGRRYPQIDVEMYKEEQLWLYIRAKEDMKIFYNKDGSVNIAIHASPGVLKRFSESLAWRFTKDYPKITPQERKLIDKGLLDEKEVLKKAEGFVWPPEKKRKSHD